MPIDAKYGRITVEKVRERPIGEDEPVFLFRAQDELLPEVLGYYYSLCEQTGSPPEHLAGIEDATEIIEAWQEQPENHTQIPGTRTEQ